MGAFSSLLIAITALDPFMPTRCWIAPEMPTAMYTLGETVWPELPTWRSLGSQPLSQMGRDAANSAPSASASSFTMAMFDCSLMPRPTETIRLAADKSTDWVDSRKRSPGWVRMCEASIRGTKSSTVQLPDPSASDLNAPAWTEANQGPPPLGP